MKKECTEQYQKTKIKFHIKISINRKNIQYNIHDKKWIKLTDISIVEEMLRLQWQGCDCLSNP